MKGGQLRFEVFPEVRIFDQRYGLRSDGEGTVEEVEALAFDFTRTAVDVRFLPSLATAQASLELLLEDPSYSASLGASQARVSAGVTEIPLGVGLGIFDWLTVGARVPFVRQRVEVDFAIDQSTANVGASPGSTSAAVQSFLGQLAAVISNADAQVDQTCQTLGDSDPSCTAGRVAVGDANALLQAFQFAYAELIFPLSGTSAATALEQRVAAVADELRQISDPAFVDSTLVAPIPWAVGTLADEAIQSLFLDPTFGVAVTPPGDYSSIWELGDIELSAAVRLFEVGGQPAAGGETQSDGSAADTAVQLDGADSAQKAGTSLIVGVGVTYRLGSGLSHLPDNLFDLGTGDGQDDIELHMFGRVDLGSRLRARADVRYGLQRAGTAVRRITAPDSPIAPLSSRSEVLWDPGEYLEVELVPEVRIAPELSFGLRYRFYSKGADRYSLGTGAADAELPPVELLDRETEVTVQHVGFGATLWPSSRTSVGGQWPLAVSAEYLTPISGSGGQTPKDGRFRVAARLFLSLW